MDMLEKKAKKNVLKEVKDMMGKMMADDIKGHKMEKVSVLAKDKKGLEEGLDKAKELVANPEEQLEEMPMEEGLETPEEEEMMEEEQEEAEMSPEEIEKEIERLKMLKEKLMSGKE